MTDTKSSDRSSDPLLINHGDGKRIISGIVRNKRTGEDPATNANPLNNKRRLILFVVLIVIIIYLNAAAVYTWDDDRSSDRVSVNHRSHVPGMRDNTSLWNETIFNESTISTTLLTTAVNSTEKTVETTWSSTTNEYETTTLSYLPPKGFLVWTDECQIPDLNPFTPDILRIMKHPKYSSCSKIPPLTRIVPGNKSNQQPVLHFEDQLKIKYDHSKISCCYSNIERSGSGKSIDRSFSLTKCISFNNSIVLDKSSEYILVTCKNSKKKNVYLNIHVLAPERTAIRERLNHWKANDTQRPVSVILMGIDSISRQNLIRTMPKTAKYIKDTGWFEMAGYNKVADNTFPNLMTLLTGYNISSAYKICNPKNPGKLDECGMVWYDYKKAGYTTAYAEDEQQISTFNYLKVGFVKPPVDYYLRPMMLAAEKHLVSSKLSGLKVCLGFTHAAEYIYDYALKFADTYKDDPYFGLFWTNSFSHNAFYTPSTMDEKMVDYIKKFNETGILDRSVVIFFSDHGMRFGPSRKLASGHLEERLPFFYIWLPSWLKDQYPDFVDALRINKHRLTTPYDVHMTLKHILELSGRVKNLPQAPDCQKCQTLFKPVPIQRSCEDVSIEDHWCTCRAFHNIDKKSPKVKLVTELTVDHINDIVKNASNGTVAHLCDRLQLKTIVFSNKEVLPHETDNSTLEGYQLSFETKPGNALFETTVRYDTATKEFTITGTISRLNSYASQSKCVSVEAVKKYCACKKK